MLINRQSRGFTIIELLLVVVILGVLLTLGFPSFRQVLLNYQIRALAESISNGLQVARANAVQRNENVQFILAADAAWVVKTESAGTVIQTRPAAESSSVLTVDIEPASATMVTFSGLGRVTSPDDSINTINIDVPTSVMPASDSKDLRIRILPGGLIRMCDPNITSSTDVRICP